MYEQKSTPWSVDGTSWDYAEHDLLEPRLENIEEELMHGFERYPSVADAGIKRGYYSD